MAPTALAGITSAGSGRSAPRNIRRSGPIGRPAPPLGPGFGPGSGTAVSRRPAGQDRRLAAGDELMPAPVRWRRACSSRSSIMTLTSAWSRVTCPTARSIAQPPEIHQGTVRPDSSEPTACTGSSQRCGWCSSWNLPPGQTAGPFPGGWRSGLGDAAGERCGHEFVRHRTPPPHAATCHQHSLPSAPRPRGASAPQHRTTARKRPRGPSDTPAFAEKPTLTTVLAQEKTAARPTGALA